ncbi:MAG: tetratricopeptide repeat protein [Candidatus Melainabacteria bacterium]|nr:tetratricopeptide repeat protein [Candidatus Melainabacteria bacterium]
MVRRDFADTALSLAFVLAWLGLIPAAGNEPGVSSRLKQYEEIVFGQARSKNPIVSRMRVLEEQVLGKVQNGSLHNRLDAIQKVLEASTSQALPPPVAPSIHTSISNTSGKSSQLKEGHIETHDQLAIEVNDLIRDGMEAYRHGNLLESEKLFHEVLGLDCNNPNAWFNLGVIAERQGNLYSALSYYRAALGASLGDREAQEAVVAVENKLRAIQGTGSDARLSRQWPAASDQPMYGEYHGRVHQPNFPTVPVTQKPEQRGGFGKFAGSAARAALGIGLSAALGGTGIRCPMCRLVRLRF